MKLSARGQAVIILIQLAAVDVINKVDVLKVYICVIQLSIHAP